MVIKIDNLKTGDIDIQEIAQLTFAARQDSLRREGQTIETVKQQLQGLFNRFSPRDIIVARAKERLVGWLCLYDYDSPFAQIWNWHPIVFPGNKEDEIATKLIEESINYAKKKKKSRLTVDFVINDENKDDYKKYSSWYHQSGIDMLDTTVFMRCDLTGRVLKDIVFHSAYRLESLLEADEDELYGCRYETFMNSEDRIFPELNARERLETFNQTVNDLGSLNEDASFVLLKNNDIIGFSVVQTCTEEGFLSSFGIHPKYRQKKLGKKLLLSSMNILAKQGFKSMSLDVDIENHPALRFYRSVGFESVNKVIGHSLLLGGN
ncbi:MAG: GNAT family N-acetyltransferase [Candidatus Odinarchaeota archaeon]